MTRFQVGQIVRLLSEVDDGHKKRGAIAIVRQLSHDGSFVQVHWQEGFQDYKYWPADKFELAEPQAAEALKPDALTLTRDEVIRLCRKLANAMVETEAVELWRKFSGCTVEEAAAFVAEGCQDVIRVGMRVRFPAGPGGYHEGVVIAEYLLPGHLPPQPDDTFWVMMDGGGAFHSVRRQVARCV